MKPLNGFDEYDRLILDIPIAEVDELIACDPDRIKEFSLTLVKASRLAKFMRKARTRKLLEARQ